MRRCWTKNELETDWQIWPNEEPLFRNKRGATRLGYVILLKVFQHECRFPSGPEEVPLSIVVHLAGQVGVETDLWSEYSWQGRSAERHRGSIRSFCGFREATRQDGKNLEDWLVQEVLSPERIKESAFDYCRQRSIEPPGPERLKRIINNAVNRQEILLCESLFRELSPASAEALEALLQAPDENETPRTEWQNLKSEPGKAGLESIQETAARLVLARKIGLPPDIFKRVPHQLLERYNKQAGMEEPHELRRHSRPFKITLLAIFIHRRTEELTDYLVDLLVETVHKMNKNAATKIETSLGEALQKAPQKFAKLYLMAKAAVTAPQGVVREVIYPAASEKWLNDLIQEVEGKSSGYRVKVRSALHRSYQVHYRRMLPEFLNNLEFRCTNKQHQPVIQALDVIKSQLDRKGATFPRGITIPLDGIVAADWRPVVVEDDGESLKINRTAYEICVLKTLRDRLRCREIWVVGSRRYRDPEEDLPRDFEARREDYYSKLGIPLDAKSFTQAIREEMDRSLKNFNDGLLANPKVKIVAKKNGFRISVSPLEKLSDPENIAILKQEIVKRWSGTSLLDVLKETDLRVNFTQWLRSSNDSLRMEKATRQRRLLLCLFGLGSNAGIKNMEAKPLDDYKELLYIRRRFFSVDGLRQAIASVANATLGIRLPQIWGETTTACASDSKQFGAWDENLLTEWHVRYGGRGVMVYWHVEKNAVCIYSQFKRVSSSEVGAMINGSDIVQKWKWIDSMWTATGKAPLHLPFAGCWVSS